MSETLRDRAKRALSEYDGELTNMENFARAELEKAAKIAERTVISSKGLAGSTVAEAIRALME